MSEYYKKTNHSLKMSHVIRLGYKLTNQEHCDLRNYKFFLN